MVITPLTMNTRGISKKNSLFISEKVYLPLTQLSNKLITSGLNDEQSKTGVVHMSILISKVKTGARTVLDKLKPPASGKIASL